MTENKAKKPRMKKTRMKKPRAKTEKKQPKKYIGRDNIKDKSIKINISTGKSSNIPPPSVSVYPQIQSQPSIQHLIHDRYEKTPLIDDKVGTSNLLQTLSTHEKKLDDLNRMFRASHFDTQQLINNKIDDTNDIITGIKEQQQEIIDGLQQPLPVQSSDLSQPGSSVMIQRIKPPQLIEDDVFTPTKNIDAWDEMIKKEAEEESKEDNQQLPNKYSLRAKKGHETRSLELQLDDIDKQIKEVKKELKKADEENEALLNDRLKNLKAQKDEKMKIKLVNETEDVKKELETAVHKKKKAELETKLKKLNGQLKKLNNNKKDVDI